MTNAGEIVDRVDSVEGASPWSISLSQREPAAYKHTSPLSSLAWKLGRDETPDRNVIRVGKSVIRDGITMHANSQVAYALPDTGRSFHATLALLGSNGSPDIGSVEFQVVTIDQGKVVNTRFESDVITSADAPVAIDIPLDGAKLLLLRVRDAGDGEAGDVAVWADARVACHKPKDD